MLNEERSTAIGFPFISATAISALRTRWPAKRVKAVTDGIAEHTIESCVREAIQGVFGVE